LSPGTFTGKDAIPSVGNPNVEIWLSFASLLRSYAAAASLNGGPAAEIAASEEAIILTFDAARLQVACDPESGAGNWTLSTSNRIAHQGRLELLHEGCIALGGKTLDLDHAAIDLIAVAMNVATNPARGER
jgi:hypothetical protein